MKIKESCILILLLMLSGCVGTGSVKDETPAKGASTYAWEQVQSRADLKIGVVDVSKLLEESPQAKAISKRLDQEFRQRREDLQVKEKDFRNLSEKVALRVLPDSDVTDSNRLNQEVLSRSRQLELARNAFLEDYNRRRAEELQKLRRLLIRVIHQLGKDEKMDLILDSAVYASKRLDLTDVVLRRLKAQAR